MRSTARDLNALAAAAAVTVGGALGGCSIDHTVRHKHEGPNGPIYPYLNEMEARIAHVDDARKSSLMAVAVLRDVLDEAPQTERTAERAALLIFEGQALRIADLQMRLRAMSATNEVVSDVTTQEIAIARKLGALARDFATPIARDLQPNRPLDSVLDEYTLRGDSLSVNIQTVSRTPEEALDQLLKAAVRTQLNGATAYDMFQAGDPMAQRWVAQMVELAALMQIDLNGLRAGGPTNAMVVDADYRIGIGARALTALWLLEVNPTIAAARQSLADSAVEQLAGQSRRDAAAFVTFREWFGSQLGEPDRSAWQRTPIEMQIKTWFQFQELARSVFIGQERSVPARMPTQAEVDAVNRMADQFELKPEPPPPSTDPATRPAQG